jgi:hypothetical protein
MLQPIDEVGRALAHVLWLGGTPCSRKTPVAWRLVEWYALPVCHCDRRTLAHEALRRPGRHPAMRAHGAMALDQRWVLRPDEALAALVAEHFGSRSLVAGLPANRSV